MLATIIAFLFLLSRKDLTLKRAFTYSAITVSIVLFIQAFGSSNSDNFIFYLVTIPFWGTIYVCISVVLAKLLLSKKFIDGAHREREALNKLGDTEEEFIQNARTSLNKEQNPLSRTSEAIGWVEAAIKLNYIDSQIRIIEEYTEWKSDPWLSRRHEIAVNQLANSHQPANERPKEPIKATPPSGTNPSKLELIDAIEKLSKLRDQGIISEAEFEQKKKEWLGL